VLLDIFVTKVIGIRPRGDDQVIVVAKAQRRLNRLLIRLNADDLRDPNVDVLFPLKELTKRKDDTAWLQASHRHLVKERLKLVVVVLIDQDDLIVIAAQLTGQLQPPEATADDYDALVWRFGNIDFGGCVHCVEKGLIYAKVRFIDHFQRLVLVRSAQHQKPTKGRRIRRERRCNRKTFHKAIFGS
jgi:hypothetical protein